MTNSKKNTQQVSAPDAPAREVAAEWVPIAELKPWKDNPRKNDGEPVRKVAESIKRFGFSSPIIARANGEIIAGHTRWKAAQTLKLDRVPVRFLDLDPAEAHLLAIADNRTAQEAEWDDDILKAVLGQLESQGADLAATGFDAKELEALLADVDGDADKDGEVIEPPVDPISKPGDLWTLGDHRLLCGDSTKAEDVERLMAGAKLSMAFTSPPYASQRKYDESSGFRPIHPDHYVEWFAAIQENVRTHCVESASWFVNIKEHAKDGQRHLYVKDLAIAHVRRWGWMLVDELCWYKRSLPGQWPDRFRNDWEPVFHFATAKGFPFNPLAVASESEDALHYVPNSGKTAGGNIGIPEKKQNRFTGLARPGNVLEISTRKVPNGIAHEAAFPPDLPAFFIKAYSDKGDNVYEPFCGSGTTLIAAEQLGRKCYGMEISPQYCDVIVKRWETMTGQTAVREPAVAEA